MKLVCNIEMSHVNEVVISHKVFYVKNSNNDYDRDDSRCDESVLKNEENGMPTFLSGNDMAEYVRDYVGVKRWKIVLSSGTINIFKKNKKNKHLDDEKKNKKNSSKKHTKGD